MVRRAAKDEDRRDALDTAVEGSRGESGTVCRDDEALADGWGSDEAKTGCFGAEGRSICSWTFVSGHQYLMHTVGVSSTHP